MSRPLRRRGGAWLIAALALAVGPFSYAASSLAIFLPEGVPQAREAEGWERIDGQMDAGAESIDYAFYVDPWHKALYAVTRYRITSITKTADGREERRRETEKLIWNPRPGSREPLACYELQPPVVGEGRSEWRSVPAGSDAYQAAMMTAIRLYGHHARRRRAAEP